MWIAVVVLLLLITGGVVYRWRAAADARLFFQLAKLGTFSPDADKVYRHTAVMELGRVLEPSLVLPTYFKYKESMLVPVRSQGKCASCWAFAVADMLADRLMVRTRGAVRANLSVQEMVSCFRPGAYVCNRGGIPETAIMYPICKGLLADKSYPYTQAGGGRIAECATTPPSLLQYLVVDPERHERHPDRVFAEVGSNRNLCYSTLVTDRVRAENVKNMKMAIFTHGPIVGTVHAYSDLYQYDGESVYTVSPDAVFRGGHAIEIVGWCEENVNTDEPGFEDAYWIARNSWGLKWPRGMKEPFGGYFYIRMGTNEAGIETRASSAIPMLTRRMEEMRSERPPALTKVAYTSYTDYVTDPERQNFFGFLKERRRGRTAK